MRVIEVRVPAKDTPDLGIRRRAVDQVDECRILVNDVGDRQQLCASGIRPLTSINPIRRRDQSSGGGFVQRVLYENEIIVCAFRDRGKEKETPKTLSFSTSFIFYPEILMPRILFITLTLFLASTLAAQENAPLKVEGPLSVDRVAELTKSFQKSLDESTELIQQNPKSLKGYSQRGDAHFFLGQMKEAVADYDRMIDLDENERASHWRRGIALFYAGRYEDAAAQFESYHSFDQIDRENGIWRYLSQHQADGREKARQGLLKYQKDDREPFPAVYKLFAGTMTPDQIMDQISRAEISKSEREKRLFYADLYIGLNHAVEGEVEPARKHLAAATRNTWGPTAGYGPNYMWHVGRLHEALLRKNEEKKGP
jgi:lipoprotein NlpI